MTWSKTVSTMEILQSCTKPSMYPIQQDQRYKIFALSHQNWWGVDQLWKDTDQPGDCLNIKMSSYQYRDPHVKDKTVLWSSYLEHGNPHTWKDCLYIVQGLGPFLINTKSPMQDLSIRYWGTWGLGTKPSYAQCISNGHTTALYWALNMC